MNKRALAQTELDRAPSLPDGGPSFESRGRDHFRRFEIRWAEPVGLPGCPYLRRWVFTAFGRSIRLHHWIASDDQRHLHDHPWDYIVLILKDYYTEQGESYWYHREGRASVLKYPRIRKSAGTITRYKAEHRHTVIVPPSGCWSLVFTGKPRRHWGFYVPGRTRLMRPLRYFSRYGHHPCQ